MIYCLPASSWSWDIWHFPELALRSTANVTFVTNLVVFWNMLTNLLKVLLRWIKNSKEVKITYTAEYKYFCLLNYKYCLTFNSRNCRLLHTGLLAFLPSAHFRSVTLLLFLKFWVISSSPVYLGQRLECSSNTAAQLLMVWHAWSIRERP